MKVQGGIRGNVAGEIYRADEDGDFLLSKVKPRRTELVKAIKDWVGEPDKPTWLPDCQR